MHETGCFFVSKLSHCYNYSMLCKIVFDLYREVKLLKKSLEEFFVLICTVLATKDLKVLLKAVRHIPATLGHMAF